MNGTAVSVTNTKRTPILVADDDPDDHQMVKKAVDLCAMAVDVHFVSDGQAVIDYLRRTGEYAERSLESTPRPALLLLDLNMPRKNGKKVLEEIRQDRNLCHIPIIILTTSCDDADVMTSYASGANSFITKPITFEGLMRMMQSLQRFWLETAQLPFGKEQD